MLKPVLTKITGGEDELPTYFKKHAKTKHPEPEKLSAAGEAAYVLPGGQSILAHARSTVDFRKQAPLKQPERQNHSVPPIDWGPLPDPLVELDL